MAPCEDKSPSIPGRRAGRYARKYHQQLPGPPRLISCVRLPHQTAIMQHAYTRPGALLVPTPYFPERILCTEGIRNFSGYSCLCHTGRYSLCYSRVVIDCCSTLHRTRLGLQYSILYSTPAVVLGCVSTQNRIKMTCI